MIDSTAVMAPALHVMDIYLLFLNPGPVDSWCVISTLSQGFAKVPKSPSENCCAWVIFLDQRCSEETACPVLNILSLTDMK